MSNSDIEQTRTVKGHLPNGANLFGRISNGLSLSGHISIGSGAGDPGTGGASAWSEITDKPFNTIDGNTLINRSGTLCVNTTDDAEQDNTRPITSSGVHVICGNINALLQAI